MHIHSIIHDKKKKNKSKDYKADVLGVEILIELLLLFEDVGTKVWV